MCERVDQAHIKRALQAGIEERVPIRALCYILRVHIFCLCMCPQLSGRIGRQGRWNFFFQLGWSSFSVILPRPPLLYISSAHIGIFREDKVNEMRIAPKKTTKHPFQPIIVTAGRNQMTSHPTDHSHSLAIDPPFDFCHDII